MLNRTRRRGLVHVMTVWLIVPETESYSAKRRFREKSYICAWSGVNFFLFLVVPDLKPMYTTACMLCWQRPACNDRSVELVSLSSFQPASLFCHWVICFSWFPLTSLWVSLSWATIPCIFFRVILQLFSTWDISSLTYDSLSPSLFLCVSFWITIFFSGISFLRF